ncbi:chaperonin 20 [Actinidia rufa]|uniref:20 kDa chaperonin, chloroplastic n=1 Tax=Actinidia rufa TaxID=165716 RepID=A0A7J0EBN9_9ERIC|nr:chaperonin 20 [Actinidia rufa]
MATAQLTASSISVRNLSSFEGLRTSTVRFSSLAPSKQGGCSLRSFRSVVVKAAATVAPKRRRLVAVSYYQHQHRKNLKAVRLLLLERGKKNGKKKVDGGVRTGSQIVYSRYAGTEVEFSGSNHLILKEDDIVGILETDDVKDMKPLNDRVLIKVAVAEEKTAGGLFLTDKVKEKPSIGTVIAVGPGRLDEEGNQQPLPISAGTTVLFSKYSGNDFKSADGLEYVALRVSDVMAVLS